MSHHSISFDDNSDSYNLYDPDNTVKSLLDLFSITFVPERKVQIKCTFSMPNYQPQPEEGFVKVTGIRICSTDGYTCVFFYDFVKQIVERDIRRRIIMNGQTGSSWRFKRFNHFKIHVPSDKLKANR